MGQLTDNPSPTWCRGRKVTPQSYTKPILPACAANQPVQTVCSPLQRHGKQTLPLCLLWVPFAAASTYQTLEFCHPALHLRLRTPLLSTFLTMRSVEELRTPPCTYKAKLTAAARCGIQVGQLRLTLVANLAWKEGLGPYTKKDGL